MPNRIRLIFGGAALPLMTPRGVPIHSGGEQRLYGARERQARCARVAYTPAAIAHKRRLLINLLTQLTNERF